MKRTRGTAGWIYGRMALDRKRKQAEIKEKLRRDLALKGILRV